MFWKNLGRTFDRCNQYLFAASGAMIVVMMFLMLSDVVTRMIGTQIMGSMDVIEYGLLYFTFFGATYVLIKDKHIKMDLLLNYANPETREMINVLTNCIGAILWLAIAFFTAWSTWDAFTSNVVLPRIIRIPKFIILAVIPFGSFFLFIESVRRVRNHIERFKVFKREPALRDEEAQKPVILDME
jgi:TRAP-type C4-dicarboxylate transport system permease small subunit